MTDTNLAGVALVITAIGTVVTAVGIAVVAVITASQKKLLGQVEKQGNSVSLELKRTNMVYARRLAVATGDAADIAIANDAEKVYQESAKRIDNKQP